MMCLLVYSSTNFWGKPIFSKCFFTNEFLTGKVVRHLVNYGRVTLLMWRFWKCRCLLLEWCFLIQLKGKLDLKLLIPYLLDMLIIVQHIDSMLKSDVLDSNKTVETKNAKFFENVKLFWAEKASSSPLKNIVSEMIFLEIIF